jgi:hypothetical protein
VSAIAAEKYRVELTRFFFTDFKKDAQQIQRRTLNICVENRDFDKLYLQGSARIWRSLADPVVHLPAAYSGNPQKTTVDLETEPRSWNIKLEHQHTAPCRKETGPT